MRKTLFAIVLLPALAWAQSSFQTIGYQGLLKKSDGTPETQTVQVTFRIYDAVTGGTALWSEVQEVTPNSGGFYAVFLGSQTAFPPTLFDGSDRYLELQIQGDSTALTPRQQISSVPYALTAKDVNGGTSGTVTTGSVSAGSVSISGKATSAATENSDGATTLATKGYVDGKFPITANGSNIQLTGTNPSSSTGFTNTLTPSNIPKAWANITTGAAGACTVNDGFGVSSCAWTTTSLNIALAQSFASSSYAPIGQLSAANVTATYFNVLPYTTSVSTITFQVFSTGGTAQNWISGLHVYVQVIGKQ